MHKIKQALLVLLPGIVFLMFWQIMTNGYEDRLFFFSAPTVVLQTIITELQTSGMWQDIAFTGFAAMSGLIIGTLCGSALGMILWMSPAFSAVSKPYIAVLGAIPVFALAPMMILWFGIGLWSKMMMSAFAVFLVATSQAYDGAIETASHHLLFARSLGASPLQIARHIIVPGSMRWVMAGLKLNVGFALIGTFIAEFISSEHGLGHYILKAGGLYDMPRVFTGIILIALLSIVIQSCINRFSPHLCR